MFLLASKMQQESSEQGPLETVKDKKPDYPPGVMERGPADSWVLAQRHLCCVYDLLGYNLIDLRCFERLI